MLKYAFGNNSITSSAIISTKSNLISEEDEYTYEELYKCLKDIKVKHKIQTEIVNIVTPYEHRKKGLINPSD